MLASVLFNLPFAIQPAQRGFEAVPPEVREAAACCGMSPLRALWTVDLPLAWPGVMTAMVLTFAHTLGEFGIVLMVGGSIPGETRTIAIAIYDRVQAFDGQSAGDHVCGAGCDIAGRGSRSPMPCQPASGGGWDERRRARTAGGDAAGRRADPA